VDRAKLFSPAAVERANKNLAEIHDQYHIDLVIDTFTELPGAGDARLKALKSSREKNKFLDATARDRAEHEGVDGLYLLVLTDPSVAVLVGYPSRRESERLPLDQGGGFSWTKRDEHLLGPFRRGLRPGGDHDSALRVLVEHFRKAIDSRVAVEPSPLPILPAAAVVGGLVGLWVLLSLVRRMAARRDSGPPPSIYQPAMLGSLFGIPAGFWIYDRLFQLERARTPPAEEHAKSPPDAEEGVPPAAPTPPPEEGAPLIEERS
jgi:hypothetical protein